MTDNVRSLYGGPVGIPEVNADAVLVLERYLEMARSGEIIGVAIAATCCDGLTRIQRAGALGSYSMLGGLMMLQSDMIKIIDAQE